MDKTGNEIITRIVTTMVMARNMIMTQSGIRRITIMVHTSVVDGVDTTVEGDPTLMEACIMYMLQ